jgi:hypothetical protein
MKKVWSSGGGTQSAAIAVLILQGKLPAPDFAAIVDTGRENSETWEYSEKYVQPAMKAFGVELHRVSKEKYATVDVWSKNGSSLLMPAFTDQNGGLGKMSNFCSYEWKKRVLERWLREQGVKEYEVWLGISTDELSRVRAAKGYRYPLIFDVPMRRHECVGLVKEFGWPDPPRSSCYMCPNKSDSEWQHLAENFPLDLQKAIDLENEVRAKDPNVFFHKSGKPLASVNFNSNQDSLFGDAGCSTGYCFV